MFCCVDVDVVLCRCSAASMFCCVDVLLCRCSVVRVSVVRVFCCACVLLECDVSSAQVSSVRCLECSMFGVSMFDYLINLHGCAWLCVFVRVAV